MRLPWFDSPGARASTCSHSLLRLQGARHEPEIQPGRRRQARDGRRRSRHAPALRAARRPGAHQSEVRLRQGAVRRLHRASRRRAGALVRDAGRAPQPASASRRSPGWARRSKPHPLQKAYIAEQVPQCGYCLSGWIMTAAAFLKRQPEADRRADPPGDDRHQVPLRHAHGDHARDQARRRNAWRTA